VEATHDAAAGFPHTYRAAQFKKHQKRIKRSAINRGFHSICGECFACRLLKNALSLAAARIRRKRKGAKSAAEYARVEEAFDYAPFRLRA
jgi:hypothetical protein